MTSVASILIVDDEPAVRDLMSRWVASMGLRAKSVSNADQALASLRLHRYDLAVLDVMMPGHDGLWLAAEIQRDHPNTAIIVATAFSELLSSGARQTPIADFLIKPFQRERFELAVERARQWRELALEEGHWHAMLSIELRDRAAHVVRALDDRVAAGEGEEDALSALVAERLPDVAAHGERVCRYARSLARELDVDSALQADLEIAARFHDVGKLAMPEPVIAKPSLLTRRENAIMRRHTEVGAEILESTRTLAAAAPAVRASHEWFQGGGYPQQSVGSAIPLVSRVIAVADAYDAMTQDRAYRPRLDAADAVAEMRRCSPSQFDPEIVDAFIAVVARH
jgi:putative two-component system response regulator